ncbi:MAG: hypothetical protein IKE60_23480 [Reyranella sp.]|nr:hypothetical protein [Reyranella sp.]
MLPEIVAPLPEMVTLDATCGRSLASAMVPMPELIVMVLGPREELELMIA